MTIEEQILQLDAAIAANPQDALLYYERGKLHWKLGHRGLALTDYNTSAHLDPSGPGPQAAAQSLAILNFYNPDQFNP